MDGGEALLSLKKNERGNPEMKKIRGEQWYIKGGRCCNDRTKTRKIVNLEPLKGRSQSSGKRMAGRARAASDPAKTKSGRNRRKHTCAGRGRSMSSTARNRGYEASSSARKKGDLNNTREENEKTQPKIRRRGEGRGNSAGRRGASPNERSVLGKIALSPASRASRREKKAKYENVMAFGKRPRLTSKKS